MGPGPEPVADCLTGQLPVAMEGQDESGLAGRAGARASKLLSATCDYCGIECPKPVSGNLK